MAQRLSTYLKNRFGKKIYRLSLTSGCTCPNRDGSIVIDGKPLTLGCSFCSEGGSGEFAPNMPDIEEQIDAARALIAEKTDADSFIAYFQSYTNTYGDVLRIKELYNSVISRRDIEILSIGTRPDCLGSDVLEMIEELNRLKPVWIELGLQTINEKTARRIGRGYELAVFDDAYKKLTQRGIDVIVHVIFGLPGETEKEMLDTIRYLASLEPPLFGIKIQNLQILKNTRIYDEYLQDPSDFYIMSMEEYTDLVAKAVSLLPKDTVVHRMTGDGPRWLLVEPRWSTDKKRVIDMLNKKTKI